VHWLRASGPQLLPDADRRVSDEHDTEQGVLRLASDEDHSQQRARIRLNRY
jgi:hypothetical protein